MLQKWSIYGRILLFIEDASALNGLELPPKVMTCSAGENIQSAQAVSAESPLGVGLPLPLSSLPFRETKDTLNALPILPLVPEIQILLSLSQD